MSLIIDLVSVPLAIAYAHIMEWVLHRYVLHGLGKNKKSIYNFHWHSHHKSARKNKYYDANYERPWQGAVLREKISLFLLLLVHSPLFIVAPFFYLTLICCTYRYYHLHRRSHLNPSWAKTHMKCHYDHHMGKNQDSNWGVTIEWVDKLFKTRIKNENN
jgi:sterol desaturase/sphingolipid hydroxylase (fatty acid hydroxylase superfamily)